MKTPKATAFGSFGYGWQQLWKYFLHLFLIGVVVTIANIPTQSLVGGQYAFDSPGFIMLNALVAAYGILVLPVITYGGNWMYLRYVRDERPNVADVFIGFKRNYLNIVLANLLVFAICGIGFLILIVPGIILVCRLSFVSYLVMDKGLDPVAAIEKSWTMTRGHGWRIFGMFWLSLLLIVVGLLLLIVGAVFAFMWIGTAFAALYHAVDLEDQVRLSQNGTIATAPA
jgi:uncharacterized membrane protein